MPQTCNNTLGVAKPQVDLDTVRAVITNRFEVLSNYDKMVIYPVSNKELKRALLNKEAKKIFADAASLLHKESTFLNSEDKKQLSYILVTNKQLRLAYQYKLSLQDIWMKKVKSQNDLIERLQEWCQKAEDSRLDDLCQFAQQLKGYTSRRYGTVSKKIRRF